MANLNISNVNKIYSGGYHAVKDFSMDIAHGEFVVLVGPSGCGKSTMLRMIAGLEAITSGEMILGDKIINKMAPADRDIAMVFQNYALYGNMTVYENMGFSLTIRHVNGDIIHEKVMKAADVVELDKQLNRKPSKLSGGQKQRVAIGRALVRDSSVFLMDEPLSNLDAKLRNVMRKELITLHEKIGATFIYVTHDQTEAMAMADRIVIMNDGVIQQIGSPKMVYNYPNNVFVSQFIGTPTMNIIEGEIVNSRFVTENFSLDIPEYYSHELKHYEGKEVLLGVRPEDLHVTGENGFTCVVDLVEFMGSEYYVSFKFSDEHRYQARLKLMDFEGEAGASLDLYFDMNKLHFFDKISSQRIG
ncbi:ABC transporter ATP-binding protein [Fusibacter bizertensis]